MSVASTSLVGASGPLSRAAAHDRERQLMHRVRSEFHEMPGLCLTLDQACRLWDLDRTTCRRVLDTLVAEGVVTMAEPGLYVRRTTA